MPSSVNIPQYGVLSGSLRTSFKSLACIFSSSVMSDFLQYDMPSRLYVIDDMIVFYVLTSPTLFSCLILATALIIPIPFLLISSRCLPMVPLS